MYDMSNIKLKIVKFRSKIPVNIVENCGLISSTHIEGRTSSFKLNLIQTFCFLPAVHGQSHDHSNLLGRVK